MTGGGRALPGAAPRPVGRARAGLAALCLGAALAAGGCDRDRDMAPKVEMPDSAAALRAMGDAAARESLLDTMPGGEMVRGDSAAEMRLLEKKKEM